MKQELTLYKRGLWEKEQQAFLDFSVFDPSTCYLNKYMQQCHVMNELKKKREYDKRVWEIEHGIFTPLVFSIYGSIGGGECCTFYSIISHSF